MQSIPLSGLLLAVVVGVVLTAAVATAHDTTPTAPPANGTPGDWATWMEAHATDHMGPGAIDWMESHMGTSLEEMARDMAADDGASPAHC